jgi:hypothetical protein
MKKMMTLSLAALMSTATLGVATPAAAQQGYYDGSYGTYYSGYGRDDRRHDRYDRRYDRRDYRADRRYDRRYDRRNYRQCDNGTGGTIIGGAVGAIAGRAIDKGNDGCRR